MRNSFLSAAVMTSMLFLFACTPSDAPVQERTVVADSNYILIDASQLKEQAQLVPLDTALTWMKTYRKLNIDTLHSFTFRTSDLLVALGIKATASTQHIRGYFGVEPKTHLRKLFFVGVVGANLDTFPRQPGRDVFFRNAAGKANAVNDATQYVLDLNYPCPTLCPPEGEELMSLSKSSAKL